MELPVDTVMYMLGGIVFHIYSDRQLCFLWSR